MKKYIKILVVGNITGHFRSQVFIQKLLKKDVADKENIIITIANPNSFQVNNFKYKFVKYIIDKINYILFLFELLIKIPFSNKIYFMAMNHMHFPSVLFINTIWRKQIIADMYISVYDAAKDRNYFQGNIIKRLANLKFEWYYKFLDRLFIEKPFVTIYVGELELKLISQLVNANFNKCNYVIIPPTSLPKKKATPSYSRKFRLCWWGTYTPFHGIDYIIEAVQLLKVSNIDFSLNMFGTENFDGLIYKNKTAELNLENEVFFHTDKTFGNGLLEEYLISNCDLVLGNFSSVGRARRTVPTKIFDAFSMCLPILTMNTDVLKDSIDIENDLFTCNINPEDICNEIINIINNPQERNRRTLNGYNHYKRSFSVEAVQNKFIGLFKSK